MFWNKNYPAFFEGGIFCGKIPPNSTYSVEAKEAMMWDHVVALLRLYWPYACVGGIILGTIAFAGVVYAMGMITHHSRG